MDEQAYRENRCKEIAIEVAELRSEISRTSIKDPRYNELDAKLIRLIQETPEVLYYTMSTWQTIREHMPIRVYEIDHKKLRGEASTKFDSHMISKAKEGVCEVEGKEIPTIEFYCQECKRIVVKVEKKYIDIAVVFILWSEGQRL